MKKLEIKTEKATLLVVDLPKEAKYFENSFDWENYYLCWHDGQKDEHGFICGNHGQITLGKGKYKHLGKVSEITEEEWKVIVDTGADFVKETTHFIDYEDDFYLYKSAVQSGLSLLKANGVLLENPIGTKPLQPWQDKIMNEGIHQKYDLHIKEWEKNQEKVWSNPHVFIKVD